MFGCKVIIEFHKCPFYELVCLPSFVIKSSLVQSRFISWLVGEKRTGCGACCCDQSSLVEEGWRQLFTTLVEVSSDRMIMSRFFDGIASSIRKLSHWAHILSMIMEVTSLIVIIEIKINQSF